MENVNQYLKNRIKSLNIKGLNFLYERKNVK